jgi:sulfite exporter TauE/SafE
MDTTLVLTAALMGLGGSWHCALMCGPLCAARPGWGLLAGRTAGYAAVGAALASASSWGANVALNSGAGAWSPWLTAWALAHALALSLGLYLLWQGRQPLWLARWGAAERTSVTVLRGPRHGLKGLPPLVTGLAWVALPCGLLQSAWVLAALSPHAATGAAVMVAFSLSTAPGLFAAPVLIAHLRRQPDAGAWQLRLTRLSGLLLAVASSWSLGHGLWVRVREVC